MPRYQNYNSPVRCFVAVRPRDRFTVTGLAATFLKILAAGFLVRLAGFLAASFVLLLIALAVMLLA
jgi:hypothetical protein